MRVERESKSRGCFSRGSPSFCFSIMQPELSQIMSKMSQITQEKQFYGNCLKSALQAFVENPESINDRDFKVLTTAILGYTPSEAETEAVFENRLSITQTEFKSVLDNLIDINCQNLSQDVYSKLDPDFKGFITSDDLRKHRKDACPNLSWNVLHDCFKSLAFGGELTYPEFDSLFDHST